MIPFLCFLGALILSGILGWALTRGAMPGWHSHGAHHVTSHARRRNLTGLGVTAALVVFVAVMESLITPISDALRDFQHFTGDWAGADLVLFLETANGSVSLGFYLAVLAGLALGLMLGTWAAARAFSITGGVSPLAFLLPSK